MPSIINFKICDNSEACDVLPICPTKAISWNKTKKTLEIDESKCIDCGACVKTCSVGAIKAAKGKAFEEIKKEYEKDQRRTSDLFIERYGSQPMDPTALVSEQYLQKQIDNKLELVAEFYTDETLMCLVKSIPIKDIFKNKILYYKLNTKFTPKLIKKYKIKKTPCLLFFENSQLKGKIEGYFNTTQKNILLEKIKKIGF